MGKGWLTLSFASWLAAGVAIAVTVAPIPFVGAVYIAGWLLLGLPLWVALVVSALRKRDRRLVRLLQAVGMIAAVFLAPHVEAAADKLTLELRFRANRATYDSVVAEAERSGLAKGSHTSNGLEFEVETQPLRVAFPQPNGVIDNWCGVIYDPTAEMLRVNKFGRGWSPEHPLVALFGGDLVSCRVLDSPYLFCCFT